MRYSDDPIADFNAYDKEYTKWYNSRPVCAWCKEHIVDEAAYKIDGELVCESCVQDKKVWIDD